MKPLFVPFLTCVFFLLFFTFTSRAQSTGERIPKLVIKKMNATSQNANFSVTDAVELVRFFMTQEGIIECESNIPQNTFKLVTQRGLDVQEILSNPDFQKGIQELGYKLEFAQAPPVLVSNKEDANNAEHTDANKLDPDDCNECGDVDIDSSLKNAVTGNANYGGTEIKIEFGKSPIGSGMGASSQYSKAQLDSIKNALFNKKPTK